MTKLTHLSLRENDIADIGPRQNSTGLSARSLFATLVSSIQPLVDNQGLSNGDSVDLSNTLLACQTEKANVMRSKAVALRSWGAPATKRLGRFDPALAGKRRSIGRIPTPSLNRVTSFHNCGVMPFTTAIWSGLNSMFALPAMPIPAALKQFNGFSGTNAMVLVTYVVVERPDSRS